MQKLPPDIPHIGVTSPMANAMESELRRVLNEFIRNHNVSWAEVVGTLELMKLDAYATMRWDDDA
jgi:hypothetical protein